MGLQTVWGPLLAWDLFLGGAGAAAYLLGVIADRLGERYRHLVKPGIFAGPIMVALGSLLLLIELGQPLRFWMAFARPFSSMMSVGILVISLFIVLGFVHIALLLFKVKVSQGLLRVLGVVTAVLGVAIMVYTGLLLGLVKAVPFWNTPALPLLFVASALLSGIGTVMLIVSLERWVAPKAIAVAEVGASVQALVPSTVLLVVVQAVALFCMVFLMAGSQATAAQGARFLVSGGYATAFWVGVVVVGLVLPLVLGLWLQSVRGKMALSRQVDVSTLVAMCLLVGGVILRYAIIAAGANVSGTL